MASAVLSLFSSSSMELSDEKESDKFLDCTIGNNSSCHTKKINKFIQVHYLQEVWKIKIVIQATKNHWYGFTKLRPSLTE